MGMALAAITLVVFGRTWRFDFTEFDDRDYVTACPLVQNGLTLQGAREAFTTFRAGNWHPLTWLSLMADRQLFGPRPWGFHVTNVVLHVANVLLLFAALQHMTGELWRSGLVAALFAIHPLHVESVAWIAERKDVLSTLFWMLALWSYSHYARRPSMKRYFLVFASLALGLMAKPMLVTLPCVLLLLDYWPLERLKRAARRQPAGQGQSNAGAAEKQFAGNAPATIRTLIVEKLPLFALVAASCCATLFAQRYAMAALTNMPLADRIATAVLAYTAYLRQTLWPVDLACFYPHQKLPWTSPLLIASALFLAAMTLAVFSARGRPWLRTGWLWYLGTLVPVIGVVQVGAQARADRYTYIPLIGIFLMAAWSIPARLWEAHRASVIATAASVIGVLMALSWRQAGCWENTTTLFERVLAVTERNFVAHANLGFVLQKQGKLTEAEAHYRKSLEFSPRDAMTHTLLAEIADRRGDGATAMKHALAAVASNPNLAESQGILGLTLARQGKYAEAIEHLQQAVRLAPDRAELHHYLGLALVESGRLEDAAEQFRFAIRLQPGHAHARNELGSILARQGRSAEAIEQFREALRLNPHHAHAQRNLQTELGRPGRK